MRSTAALGAIAVVAAALVAGHEVLRVAPAVLLGGLVLLAVAVLVVERYGVDGLAIGLLVGAVATTPPNAVVLAGLKPAPVLLAGALLLLGVRAVACRRPVAVPPWVWVLGSAIVLIAVITLVHPPSVAYLAGRYRRPDAAPLPLEAGVPGLLEAAGWLVAAVALPLAVCLAASLRPGLLGRLADAWALGAVASAVVAITDEVGLTDISAALLGAVNVSGRQAGLAVQPVHLAVTTAITLPVVVWRLRLADGTAARLRWGAAAAVLLGCLTTAESRAGLVAAVVGLAALMAADRTLRPWLVTLGGLGAAALTVALLATPDLVVGAAQRLRLAGAASAETSNEFRLLVAEQAWRDFAHSPLHGIGLEVSVHAHSIWLQLLAAGGALLLLGFLAAMTGCAVDGVRRRHQLDGLPLALTVSTVTWLALGVVANQLADPYLYVPFALVAGLRAVEAADDPSGVPGRPPAPTTPSAHEATPPRVAALTGGVHP